MNVLNRILVTGATGFVGRRLVPRLLSDGQKVQALSRSEPDFSSPVQQKEALQWRLCDLTDPHGIYDPFVENCDAVVHLAGQAHDPSAGDSAYETLNYTVTRRLAQTAATNGVKHFIFVSTIKVNGGDYDFAERSYSEHDRPVPEGRYGESKWRAEQALYEACETSGMRCTVLRPPLIYGPGVKANFLALMKAVYKGLPLPLAAIDNRRSLIYVDNLCDVIVRLLRQAPADNKTYVVKDETLSTPELIRSIAEGLRVEPRLFSVPVSLLKLAGSVTGKRSIVDRLTQSLVVDDSAIRRDLGWQPPVSLQQGTRETAE
ncbi:MAG: NAD-dependent epimerase/dehydratase family protein [Gammaproteobacteria bacterium]|nr:NAD-dependent epimerase/dehydratase family protein [Gammaproteobacteria bacterium]